MLMISRSRAGSTLPMTCWMSSFSKQRTTWTTASTSRMLARNWLPSPSPWLAPFTSPAMSRNSTVAGRVRSGWTNAAIASSRGSGTWTTPVLGSMVAKG